ncbi:MAG: hypothetical protein OEU86_03700 [Gammaproteobacteria bacterium]|nr:hypothetical protein [Gammaproteobacteria bacterium]
MIVWLGLISYSVLAGYLCARFISGKKSVVLAGGIPWFSLLAAIVYTEYFTPYQGGGASMWPIAQLFGGAVAAVIGVMSCNFFKSDQNQDPSA